MKAVTLFQLAIDWKVIDYRAGYVTKFEVKADYIQKFQIQNVGGEIHNELWIPAE
jgi:hypothetical protein